MTIVETGNLLALMGLTNYKCLNCCHISTSYPGSQQTLPLLSAEDQLRTFFHLKKFIAGKSLNLYGSVCSCDTS